MDTLVRLTGGGTDIALHVLGQGDAALHVLVLYQLEEDAALGRVGVETGIVLLVVLLVEDDGVLALGNLEVLDIALVRPADTALTQRVGLVATGEMALGQRVDMDGDEEVGLRLVGNLGTLPQLEEAVGLTGVDDAHVGTVALHHLTEGEGVAQGQRLLLRLPPDGTGIMAAVPGIDDEREPWRGTVGRQHQYERHPEDGKKSVNKHRCKGTAFLRKNRQSSVGFIIY